MKKIRSNPIKTKRDWEEQKEAVSKDPGKFHGAIAKREIFWYVSKLNAWVKHLYAAPGWIGFDAKTGKPLEQVDLPDDFEPWTESFNKKDPPFYKWFVGGLTNACFNEVDAHVLNGRGD